MRRVLTLNLLGSFLFLTEISPVALAGQVSGCKIKLAEMRCVIQADDDEEPSMDVQVIAYDQNGSWIASGIISKIGEGNQYIAGFDDFMPQLGKGATVVIEDQEGNGSLSWEQSFR